MEAADFVLPGKLIINSMNGNPIRPRKIRKDLLTGAFCSRRHQLLRKYVHRQSISAALETCFSAMHTTPLTSLAIASSTKVDTCQTSHNSTSAFFGPDGKEYVEVCPADSHRSPVFLTSDSQSEAQVTVSFCDILVPAHRLAAVGVWGLCHNG